MHVNNAVNFVLQQHGNLEKKVQENVHQIWGNQEELKSGMDAAEFNLRAHQKALNAVAIEFERLVTHLNDEVFATEHDMTVLELTDVELPAEDGDDPDVVRRLDWPYYHKEVESDLKVIADLEERKAAEAKAAAQAAVEKAAKEEDAAALKDHLSALTDASAELVKAAEEAGNDPAEVQAEHAALMALVEKVSDALGKKLRGEEYDQSILDEAQSLIDSTARAGDGESSIIHPDSEDEAREATPPPQDDIPKGASVFGG